MWRDASFMWVIWLIQVCQSFFFSPLTYLLLFNLSATYLLSWHNIFHTVIYKSVYWCEKYQEDETHVSDGKQYTLWYIRCPLFSPLLSNFLSQKKTFFFLSYQSKIVDNDNFPQLLFQSITHWAVRTCWARRKCHKVRITVHLGLIRVINSGWSHSLGKRIFQ